MKFLHAADLHLDSPMHGLAAYDGAPVEELRGATRRALVNLVDLALEEQVAFVLIAGDVYDGSWRDFNTGLFYVAQIRRLREAGIPVVAIAGNHDAESRMTKQLPLPEGYVALSARKPQTIELADLGVAIHGQSFATAAVTEDLSAAYPAPRPGILNIGLLHTSAGGRSGHENYAPCSVDALVARGYDYWALGHVHGREVLHEDPWVVFPGNVQGRHARETGPKGATLVTVDDGRIVAVEHRDLDVVRWAACVADVSACATPDEVAIAVVDALREHIDAAGSRLVAARVTVEGDDLAGHEVVEEPLDKPGAPAPRLLVDVVPGDVDGRGDDVPRLVVDERRALGRSDERLDQGVAVLVGQRLPVRPLDLAGEQVQTSLDEAAQVDQVVGRLQADRHRRQPQGVAGAALGLVQLDRQQPRALELGRVGRDADGPAAQLVERVQRRQVHRLATEVTIEHHPQAVTLMGPTAGRDASRCDPVRLPARSRTGPDAGDGRRLTACRDRTTRPSEERSSTTTTTRPGPPSIACSDRRPSPTSSPGWGDVELEDGTTVHVYRHTESRSFLHVTDDGRALIYVGDEDRYRFVPVEDAVVNAFVSRQDPMVPFEDEAGCAALDAMFRVCCEVSDELGIERPERDVVIEVPPPSDRAA